MIYFLWNQKWTQINTLTKIEIGLHLQAKARVGTR